MDRANVPAFPLISDADLTRTRRDPAFRQEMLARQLQALITVIAVLKATPEAAEPGLAQRLREGADLAVKLSDILKDLAARQAARASEPAQPA